MSSCASSSHRPLAILIMCIGVVVPLLSSRHCAPLLLSCRRTVAVVHRAAACHLRCRWCVGAYKWVIMVSFENAGPKVSAWIRRSPLLGTNTTPSRRRRPVSERDHLLLGSGTWGWLSGRVWASASNASLFRMLEHKASVTSSMVGRDRVSAPVHKGNSAGAHGGVRFSGGC